MRARVALKLGAAVIAACSLFAGMSYESQTSPLQKQAYTPVTVPNGSTLPWVMENGVKVFHLTAELVKREFAPGLIINCWGYNGQTPGPVIEAIEGDRVRILVTNHLPESTTIHWHGIRLPNGMDGVAGLTQPPIPPGETFQYEFTLQSMFLPVPHVISSLALMRPEIGLFTATRVIIL